VVAKRRYGVKLTSGATASATVAERRQGKREVAQNDDRAKNLSNLLLIVFGCCSSSSSSSSTTDMSVTIKCRRDRGWGEQIVGGVVVSGEAPFRWAKIQRIASKLNVEELLPVELIQCIAMMLDGASYYRLSHVSRTMEAICCNASTLRDYKAQQNSWKGDSLVDIGLRMGDMRMIRACVEADMKQQLENGMPEAVSSGHVEVVRFLLSVGVYSDNALWAAAEKGCVDIVKLMMADPNVGFRDDDSDSDFMLELAAENGHEEVVRRCLADAREMRNRIKGEG
jgi:hypothetical protein